MTTVNSPVPKMQFFDSNGNPAVNYRLFTYIAGTTTKQATYTDYGGGSSNTNPIVLDYRGECNLWVPANVKYKYVFAPPGTDDPPTSPIWTVDNMVNSQLVTLYGGVDSGTSNAYVLNFTANFTSYTDGIVIYWIPSNTNTGASTVNVNGLGIVSIVNYDGSALKVNQIVATSICGMMYVGGAFVIITNPLAVTAYSGTWAPIWGGFSVAPTGNMSYQVVGKTVTLEWLGGQGTSNAAFMGISNVPFGLRPTSTDATYPWTAGYATVIDNGTIRAGSFYVSTSGSINFAMGNPLSDVGFTAAGTKGIGKSCTLTYMLD